MTISGKNSNIKEPKMFDKVEDKKNEAKVSDIVKEILKEPKEQIIKDKIENHSKYGKAEKFVDIFSEPIKQFPAGFIESIRNAEGVERDEKLLNFKQKIDNMSEKDLKAVRDYLVKEMANPKNNDDPLLGALLNQVNMELDSRRSLNIVKPIPNHFPPGIEIIKNKTYN
ncbi:MAG: hypothetical protein KatS3mg068_0964 [Candidatus Sericytochromatia bacterium]|nr:MAG: hypothetical protein KatS3mg068_0964 [Candidatus Sericytochromatia bacterium]